MKRLKLLFQHRHNQTKHMTYMIETIKYWYFLLQTSERDSERNSERIFMKRWQCPIYYGTIETLFWLEKCLFLWVSSLLLINKKYTIHFRRELENDQKKQWYHIQLNQTKVSRVLLYHHHIIYVFNYKAWNITNKQSQFTMQFGPA